MDITVKSSKEEIIDSSLELIDEQASQLSKLREDRQALGWLLIATFTLGWLF